MEAPKFSEWCIIEVFGRVRLAGLVSEQTVAGQGFVRVDIPATKRQPAFSRLFGPSSIYSMTPVTEEVGKACAENFSAPPLNAYDIRDVIAKLPKPGEDSDDLPY